jgi:hypothetical protein
VGIITGAGLFAAAYPKLENGILKKGEFGEITIPQLFNVNPWLVIIPLCAALIGLLSWLERGSL